uniref:histidine kinase n=1 Tax=Roseihalotalea indica TaxID=2867963 RepID=A0AA49JCT5_9BACT|nr:tetratricopeptide repeat protein [Tunicatimonas sp. TK19036]
MKSFSQASNEASPKFADSLFMLIEQHFQQNDTITGFQKLDSMLNLYTTLMDSATQSNILNEYGYYYYTFGNFTKSINYYQRALLLDREMPDTVKIIGRLRNIGMVYRAKGLPPLAIQYYNEALTLAQAINRSKSVASVSNSMGLLMYEMEQYAKSLAYYRTSLRAWSTLQDTILMAYTHNNMGQVYHELGKYSTALMHLKQAKQWKEALGEEQSLATTLHNLGDTYLSMDSSNQAKQYLHESLALANAYDLKHEMATVSNNLAELYLQTAEYPLARHYLDTARLLTQELGARHVLLENLYNEARYQEAVGNLAEALSFQKQWAALQDSIFQDDRLQVVQMQGEFALQQEELAREQAEERMALAQAESRLHRLLLWIAIGAKMVFIALSLLLYRLYKAYRRLSKQNELLVREQHHRVENNFNTLASMFRMHARRLEDEGAKQAMDESQYRIQSMELIHRQLYGEELSRVSMLEYLQTLVQSVLDAYGSEARLHLHVDDITLNVDKAPPVGLITNEVVSNACKYAFPNHPNPELRVGFHKNGSNTYRLIIHDNGIGFDTRQLSEEGSFGLKLIRLQADQLRGQYSFKNQNGTLFQLTFSDRNDVKAETNGKVPHKAPSRQVGDRKIRNGSVWHTVKDWLPDYRKWRWAILGRADNRPNS